MLDAFEQIENNNVERSAFFCNILVLKRRVFVEKKNLNIDVSLIFIIIIFILSYC
jgi:hypothetical protein